MYRKGKIAVGKVILETEGRLNKPAHDLKETVKATITKINSKRITMTM